MTNAPSPQKVPCPTCNALAPWGNPRCAACGNWVVVRCAFCGQCSPHNAQTCLSCGEPFAGAVQRKVARDRNEYARMMQARQQPRYWATPGVVSSPILGAGAWAMAATVAPSWGFARYSPFMAPFGYGYGYGPYDMHRYDGYERPYDAPPHHHHAHAYDPPPPPAAPEHHHHAHHDAPSFANVGALPPVEVGPASPPDFGGGHHHHHHH